MRRRAVLCLATRMLHQHSIDEHKGNCHTDAFFENFAIEKSWVFICFLTIAFRKPFKTLGVCNDFDTRAQRPRGCPLCGIFCNELLTWTHVEKQILKFILVFTISSPCDGGLGISRQAPSYVKNKVFLHFHEGMIRIWYYLTRMDRVRFGDRAKVLKKLRFFDRMLRKGYFLHRKEADLHRGSEFQDLGFSNYKNRYLGFRV